MAPADTTESLAIARDLIAAEAEARTGRLYLNGLGLPFLPEELFALTHLRELDFGSELFDMEECCNHIGDGRERLAVFTQLERLNVKRTDLPSLDIVRSFPNLTALIISWTSITDLAPLAACVGLRFLDCSDTAVADLAPLTACTALRDLICSRTRVADLTPLAACTALEFLSCSNTPVTNVTPLAACATLKFIACSDTPVADLAPLAACTSLQSLDCSGTPVADLAPLTACAALRFLGCSKTRVTDLAPLAACATLQSFSCSRCRLTGLPEELIHAPSLTSLEAYGTTIPGIPDGILSTDFHDNCLPRLRAYFTDLAAGVAVVPGVKLLLLGNGRVGKTQIARRLAGQDFERESDSTHGIRIDDIALPGLPDTRLWLWDFGGQEIYHGTHALFLRSPAVLAVVWADETEGEPTHSHGGLSFRNHPLPYWLDIARHQGHPASPTLVVQTRCDAPGSGAIRPPADEELLAAARCVGHLRVSAAPPPRGFAALTEALADAVAWQRERLGVPRVGLVWRTVQLRLEAMRAADQDRPEAERCRLLTMAEFAAICREEGGVTAPEVLLRYLDATGTVLHRLGLFDDRILLDQNWAMEAVYAVFDRDRGAYRLIRNRNRGRFTLDDLAHTVWAGYGPDDRRLFLSLMRSCGIAFRHRVFGEGEDEIEEFIAPELLPEREEGGVAARWDEGAATETRVFKHPLLHGGLIRAIMAELGERAGPDALYWQGGLCGYEAGTRSRFLIEERMTGPWQGEIVVRTQGGAAAELLARLVWEVEWQQQHLSLHPEPADQPPAARPAEPERPMTFSQEPGKDPDWYVSYAWSDDTPEGREREVVVDRLCAAAEAAGNPILRDKKALNHGDSISAFMGKLGAGSRVFVILSEKYLRSPACMFELSEIWRNCKHDRDLFRRTVRVYTLPCAKIWSARDRLGHAIHWKTQHKELDDAVKEHGTTILGDHDHHALRQMGFFFTHVGDMLGTLADTVQPRSFDELVKHGFAP